ncbi:MAG TPA: winged helix-turn-helix domain-containing protein [Candidatus Sulfotelmatobacter sp.]|jgi:TolB-like protein/DNA-binding winged helix-turn-helix (wHTH) protein
MFKTVNNLYAFGPFVLDPAERLLYKRGAQLDLPPRAFDTLLAMVSSDGHLLEKDALMRTVWGDTVVEESNLSQVVYLLRKALHNGEHGEQYIQTVPKRGYRFVARVHEIEPDFQDPSGPVAEIGNSLSSQELAESSPLDAGTPTPPIENGSHRAAISNIQAQPLIPAVSNRRRAFVILAVLLALASFTLAAVWKKGLFNSAPTQIRSIAVLPLQNLSNDPNQEYFVDGMTDELITDLAQIRALKVVSKTSVMRYKGTRTPLPQIGRSLKVDAIVEGSVLRSGDHVRITAQLIRTATDRHIWAAAYDGDLKDVLSLQARVAAAITNEVKLNLTTEESGHFRSQASTNPEAFDLYLRGRYALNQRNLESFKTAIGFFHQAIEKDPNFALAYAGLADSRLLLVLYGENPAQLSEAKDAAEKALAIDPTLAEAHTSLAAVLVMHDWDWQGAEREFQRAIELNPNCAQAHHWYGNLLLGPEGRHDEAIAELLRAQELDPLSLIISADVGFGYYLAGKYDLALQTYQKVLAMDPNFVPAHYYLSKYYEQTAAYDLWLKEMVADQNLSGQSARAQFIQGHYTHGGFSEVMNVLASRGQFTGMPSHKNFSSDSCSAAAAKSWLQRNSEALNELEICYRSAPLTLIYLKVDPVWIKLHAEPRYQDLLRRMGLR